MLDEKHVDHTVQHADSTRPTYTLRPRWALLKSEEKWRARQPFLANSGLLLRPRYSPDWMPSWLGTSRDPFYCEDSIRSRRDEVLDAVRQIDGYLVSIKVVRRDNDEIAIANFLSSEGLQRPTNHCVPIFGVLDDPLNPAEALLVMPYLRPFNDPRFCRVGEVLDFLKQTLEGLCFMHSQGVAHRDCASANIMMDARNLYPDGHHPVRLNCSPDVCRDVSPLSRLDHRVKYYFIDFGMSSRFEPGDVPLVVGTQGRDQEPPELSEDIPYNPFALDVYILGHLYQTEFLLNYEDLEFLIPLVSSMIHPYPGERPSAHEALRTLQQLQNELTDSTIRWRLRSKKESETERIIYDVAAIAKEGFHWVRNLAG